MSAIQTESQADATPPSTLAPPFAAPAATERPSLLLAYLELFESRATRIACLIGVALLLVPNLDELVGIPGWAAGLVVLACTVSLSILTHEPPPERMLATRTTAAYAGNSSRTHERIQRRKDFFPALTRGIERAQAQGSLYTLVVAGLKPSDTSAALNEVYELRLECLLASCIRDRSTPIGRLGGCSYGIGLVGLSGDETRELVDELRRELADLFSGRARPYVGTAVVTPSDDAKSTYERALQSRRTLTTNPFLRLVYWATKA